MISIPSAARFGRRELDLWLAAMLFARYVLGLIHRAAIDQGSETVVNLFQFFAWFVLAHLLVQCGARNRIRWRDAGLFALCGLCAALPGDNAVWAACTLGSICLSSDRSDRFRTSAAAMLAALAINGLWAPVLFKLLGYWFLKIDTALVAAVLQSTGRLTAHSGNVLSVGANGLEVLASCSSFRNISMALLAWLSFTKLARPYWLRSDVLVAAACVAVTLAWNTLRLYILAVVSFDARAFEYWHVGNGGRLFAAALAFTIAFLSVAGAARKAS